MFKNKIETIVVDIITMVGAAAAIAMTTQGDLDISVGTLWVLGTIVVTFVAATIGVAFGRWMAEDLRRFAP